jgi:hypothetical protein
MSLILSSEPSRETPALKSHNRVSIGAVPSTEIGEWFANLIEGGREEEKKRRMKRRGVVSKYSVIFRLTTN